VKSVANWDQGNIVEEVSERFTDLIAALNQRDVGAWEDCYSKTEFLSAIAGGDFFASRSDWVQSIRSLFSARAHQHVELRKVQVVPLAPDVALLTCQDYTDMQLEGKPSARYRHVFTMIWKKGQEGWQIRHSHESWVNEPAR